MLLETSFAIVPNAIIVQSLGLPGWSWILYAGWLWVHILKCAKNEAPMKTARVNTSAMGKNQSMRGSN